MAPSTATIAKEVKRVRDNAIDNGNYFSCAAGPEMADMALDDQVKKFMDKKLKEAEEEGLDDDEMESIPAVDLNAGWGVLTAQWALRYREPIFPVSLEWYPVGNKIEEQTKPGLAFLRDEAIDNDILFHDDDGKPVHPNELVQLRGLTSTKYNNYEGKILEKDETKEGRYAVALLNKYRQLKPKRLSIKRENIFAFPTNEVESAVLRNMQASSDDGEVASFFDSLSSRTRSVDVMDPNTWDNLSDLFGKCALVTYGDYSGKDDFEEWFPAGCCLGQQIACRGRMH